jgi:hypothetical protein
MTWDEGRNLVPRVERSYRGDGTYQVREWTEEVLTPLARRVAPPTPPSRRWMLWAAGGTLLIALCCAGSEFAVHAQALTFGLIAAPGLVVLYAVEKVRNEAKAVRAQALWEQTWYCHGCDQVWIPGTGKRAVPSQAMSRMLWRYS